MRKKPTEESAAFESKQDAVYKKIQIDMWARRYPPGTTLSERKLSEDFGVSRSPVREALKRYVGEGLLDQTDSNRVIVPEVTRDEICEVCDMLELLEPYAVRRCAERINDATAEEFRMVVERMRRANEEDDYEKYILSDLDFHKLIIYRSGFKRVLNPLRSLCSQRMRIMISFGVDKKLMKDNLQQYESIYEKLTHGDAADAERQARAYIYQLRDYYLRCFDSAAINEGE